MGPSVIQIGHLFILFVVNSLTIFVLAILLARTAWSLVFNTTVIETWEIERHETLLRRAKHFHGYLTSPHGTQVRIRKQEFPYDIGIWENIKAGMGGSSNVSVPRKSNILINISCSGPRLVLAFVKNV